MSIDPKRSLQDAHPLVFAVIPSPLDDLTLVARGDALVAIYFAQHARRPADATLGERVSADAVPVLARTRAQLGEYFAGERDRFDLLLDPDGEEFAQRVWARLREISRGHTISYGEIAAELGQPGAAQAVGGAVGRNPLSIVVPCHRVVGAGGSLTGFAGGVARKAALLELEEGEDARASRLF
ncbi:methylated-DNA--[protein]-cysteine S-methyltransferase [Mycetocola tolaasinivorans]|uniref:methylated-DNA--[protein]-cysteine S-methyltransferase n=1 Tax=Mycetocola tolaasinivorans TaxID=76635 RepID=UPI001FE5E7F3|nr:methylated-DNA--[protein]-cysteine S-methyltransferase [Mycetocola tolaasinivorans]